MRILGYDYKLIADPFLDCMGEMQTASLRIKIDKRLVPQQQMSTLLHEIIEALNRHLKLDLTEQQIMGLEAGLFQVLRDANVDLTPIMLELQE